MKFYFKILPLLLLIPGLSLFAQSHVVTGTVVDDQGLEAIGASVVIKGTTTGVITNLEGKYQIEVPNPQTDVLVFSYVGMETQEVPVNGQRVIDIEFEPSSFVLDEVVSIGYGTTRRRDLTGAISSVKAEDIARVPVTNVTQALAGKVAGLTVTQSDGSPDASISIRVRGGLSITQDNEPLYVIDGFPNEDGLAGLDPSDIASIEVLKDASATAIYGARGGNGVILISTKQGSEGKPRINYDMYFGIKKMTNKMALLSTEDFVRLEYERAMLGGASEITKFASIYGDGFEGPANQQDNLFRNMYAIHATIHDVYGDRPGIDWQGLIFDDANPKSQNHKISVTGGTKNNQYLASYSFSDDQGIMMESGFKRHNIRLNYVQQLTPKARFTTNVSYIDEETRGLGSLSEQSYFSRMQHIIQYRPTIGKNRDDYELVLYQNDPITDDDSGNQMQNPIVSIDNEKRVRNNRVVQLNGNFTYEIIKDLTYRGNMGYRVRAYQEDMFYQFASRQAIGAGAPYGFRIFRDYYTLNYNNTLTYRKRLPNRHNLEFMIGQESNSQQYKYMRVESRGFPKENFALDDMALGESPNKPETDRWGEELISFFGRVNYSHLDKYLATVTLRADGSSKFGTNSKWGYFPSASVAWRINEEEFLRDVDVLSNLKLRLSYGTTGNNRIGTFRSLSRMSSSWQSFNNETNASYHSSQLPNPDLKWETNISRNLGIDVGLFDQRIQLVMDLYSNETSDLLLESRVPLVSGYQTTLRNIGKTRNNGVEFTINTVNIQRKDFHWESSFNIATNQNKVLALTDVDYFTIRTGWAGAGEFNEDDYIIRVGDKLGSMYGYKWIGLYEVDDFDYDPDSRTYTVKKGIPYDPDNYPKPGYNKFENTDDSDDFINSNDKQIIGNASPDFYGGFTNTFQYKQFDLSFAFNFSIGNDVLNANKMYFTKMNNRYRNSLAMVTDRFTYINDGGENVFTFPDELKAINERKTNASIDGSANLKFHSNYIEDGSYLRLNNLTLGYTLPTSLVSKAHISNARLYLSGYNLLLFTKYSGFDPDVNAKPNGGLTPGVDWGAYPRSLSFVLGLNLTL
ncbi:MAG TPA: TonB-dependent receptor [Bacteroidales bacterium]|jgi:TonB-linked SusC/RagA family outer membrane protein|nr:TonB-dependent receptor [Bacteroidales bacterium]